MANVKNAKKKIIQIRKTTLAHQQLKSTVKNAIKETDKAVLAGNKSLADKSLKKAINQAHGGEIFLLHGVSTTDTKMLGDLIDGLRAKGFKFGYYAKTN